MAHLVSSGAGNMGGPPLDLVTVGARNMGGPLGDLFDLRLNHRRNSSRDLMRVSSHDLNYYCLPLTSCSFVL